MVKDLMVMQVPSTSDATATPLPEDEEDTHSNTHDHYWMSKKHASRRDLGQWLTENSTDHALTVSLDHLVCCPITDRSLPTAFSNPPSRPSAGTHQRDAIRWR